VSLVPSVPTGRIDQILYQDSGRTHLLRGPGVGPVASSLDHGDLIAWDAILRPRLPDDASYEHPSLCYLGENEKGLCALLYRTHRGANRSSGFAHVLIGTSADLPVHTAIGLWQWRWPGAITPENAEQALNSEYDGRLSPITAVDDLLRAANAERNRLTQTDLGYLEANFAVIEVLSRLRSVPSDQNGRKFTIIAQPGEQRIQILNFMINWLHDRFLAGGFSAHERQYDDAHQGLPWLVFTSPNVRHSSYQISRIRIDLSRVAMASEHDMTRAANILVREYRQEGVKRHELDWVHQFLEHISAGSPDTVQGVGSDKVLWPVPHPREQPLGVGVLEAGVTSTAEDDAAVGATVTPHDPAHQKESQRTPSEYLLLELVALTMAMKVPEGSLRSKLQEWSANHAVPIGDAGAFRDCLRQYRFYPESALPDASDNESYELTDQALRRLADVAYPSPPGQIFPKPLEAPRYSGAGGASESPADASFRDPGLDSVLKHAGEAPEAEREWASQSTQDQQDGGGAAIIQIPILVLAAIGSLLIFALILAGGT